MKFNLTFKIAQKIAEALLNLIIEDSWNFSICLIERLLKISRGLRRHVRQGGDLGDSGEPKPMPGVD
ncbi:hypothetical protein CL673_00320 [Candidatus Bathyarchaeota archaeon]|nr:hypothetical protein [Candidatus Bathyarchaeota archaeon]